MTVSGCARPKYVTVEETAGPRPQEQADCSVRFRESGLCLSWVWEKKPTSKTTGSLVFKIYRANRWDGSPVMIDPGAAPALRLWMPGMGHGSSPTTVESVDLGTYRAKDVFFVMPGEWDLHFELKEDGAVRDEAVVHVSL